MALYGCLRHFPLKKVEMIVLSLKGMIKKGYKLSQHLTKISSKNIKEAKVFCISLLEHRYNIFVTQRNTSIYMRALYISGIFRKIFINENQVLVPKQYNSLTCNMRRFHVRVIPSLFHLSSLLSGSGFWYFSNICFMKSSLVS